MCRRQLREHRSLCPQGHCLTADQGKNFHGWAARDPSWMQAGPSAWKNFTHLPNGLPKRVELWVESQPINIVNCTMIFHHCFWFLGEEGVPKVFISLQSYLFPSCTPCHPCLSIPFHRAAGHHSKLFFSDRGADSNPLPSPCTTTPLLATLPGFLCSNMKGLLLVWSSW